MIANSDAGDHRSPPAVDHRTGDRKPGEHEADCHDSGTCDLCRERVEGERTLRGVAIALVISVGVWIAIGATAVVIIAAAR